jgi:hypothetical protein
VLTCCPAGCWPQHAAGGAGCQKPACTARVLRRVGHTKRVHRWRQGEPGMSCLSPQPCSSASQPVPSLLACSLASATLSPTCQPYTPTSTHTCLPIPSLPPSTRSLCPTKPCGASTVETQVWMAKTLPPSTDRCVSPDSVTVLSSQCHVTLLDTLRSCTHCTLLHTVRSCTLHATQTRVLCQRSCALHTPAYTVRQHPAHYRSRQACWPTW